MRFVAAWSTALLLLAGNAGALPRVESYRLANGLRVHLQEDHARPRVGVAVRFNVGQRDDPRGYRGLSHFVEHMFFQGSANVSEDAFFRHLEAAGTTEFNGMVSLDDTVCFEELPTQSWPIALWLESDRMAFTLAHLDQRTLDIQREVIRNEWRLFGGHVPLNVRTEVLSTLLYPPEHPYHLEGESLDPQGAFETADIDAIGVREVSWFFQHHYRPSKASLALVGDFSTSRAKQLIERYFGPIRSVGRDPPRLRPTPVRLHEERTATIRSPTLQGGLVIAWPTPALGTVEDAALDVIAAHLSASRGALNRRLLRRKLINRIRVRQQSQELESVFFVDALVGRAHPIDETLQVIDEELVRLSRSLTESALARARRRLIVSVLRSTESNASRAIALSRRGRPLEAQVQRYAALDLATVRRVARNYLPLERRIVLRFER